MVGDIFQPTHLLFVLVVALLVLGPKRLPEVGKTLGSGIRDFRQAISGESSPSHDWNQSVAQTSEPAAAQGQQRHRPPDELDPLPDPAVEVDDVDSSGGFIPDPIVEPVRSAAPATVATASPVTRPAARPAQGSAARRPQAAPTGATSPPPATRRPVRRSASGAPTDAAGRPAAPGSAAPSRPAPTRPAPARVAQRRPAPPAAAARPASGTRPGSGPRPTGAAVSGAQPRPGATSASPRPGVAPADSAAGSQPRPAAPAPRRAATQAAAPAARRQPPATSDD